MADPRLHYFQLSGSRPPFAPLAEKQHPDFHRLTKYRARIRPRDVFDSIDTAVVHATPWFATAHAVDAWKTVKASP